MISIVLSLSFNLTLELIGVHFLLRPHDVSYTADDNELEQSAFWLVGLSGYQLFTRRVHGLREGYGSGPSPQP
jgi:hypothetical protein